MPESAPLPPLSLRDRLGLAVVAVLMRLPFATRSRVAGRLGRLSPRRERVAKALRHFLPDLPAAEVTRICAAVPGNYLRLIIEVLSPADLAEIARGQPLEPGPGLAALDRAHAEGRPVILVSGHFGNYDAWRHALIARGFRVGCLFKDLLNPALNTRYRAAIEAPGQPAFADTAQGRVGMVRFLRAGGMLGMLFDLDRPNGVLLDFLGRPTRTVLSMAELALRYNALLVPIFARRLDSEPGFHIEIDPPIPHSDPRTMTQAMNDALAARVRAHPEQWVWWHRRRKKGHP